MQYVKDKDKFDVILQSIVNKENNIVKADLKYVSFKKTEDFITDIKYYLNNRFYFKETFSNPYAMLEKDNVKYYLVINTFTENQYLIEDPKGKTSLRILKVRT